MTLKHYINAAKGDEEGENHSIYFQETNLHQTCFVVICLTCCVCVLEKLLENVTMARTESERKGGTYNLTAYLFDSSEISHTDGIMINDFTSI